jgi:soluble lytic murein transglycosylase
MAAAPVRAPAEDIMALIRNERWGAAEAAAARAPDPVVAKLVTYYRLLDSNDATQAEIGRFMAESPDWPLPANLARRRDEAIAADPSDPDVVAACAEGAATSAGALSRCAEASASVGALVAAFDYARQGWIVLPGDAAEEAHFLSRWAAMLGRNEQVQRFDRLLWNSDTAGATRQVLRLDPADRALAEARLALRRDDRGAPAIVQALPEADQASPGLVLDYARYLRRANLDAEAAALWLKRGAAAEHAVAAEHLAAFWDERNIIARHRMRDGFPQEAYAIADGAYQTGTEQMADAAFLAGFIALRKLNDPALATAHFMKLAAVSKSAITQGRAHYWLARAATDPAVARREYQAAAAFPNTFYGQLGAIGAGEGPAGLAKRIASARDPGWDATQALGVAGRELARAAVYLVAWGEPDRARAFMLRLSDLIPDADDRSMVAHLANGFGMPDTAIGIARKAGRAGLVLLDAGWPVAATVPPDIGLEPALALGIIRQETSFDSTTISSVGARGLMQLMPDTASLMARSLRLRATPAGLTNDNALNIRLGASYLRGLIGDFRGCLPLGIAAYNAGPTKVVEWLGAYGDPRGGSVDILDWIEEIPYGETRNYVERVIENEVIYRAKQGVALEHPLTPWLK